MLKQVTTPTYNYVFDTKNGNMARWGISSEDDPQYSPIGPEILDIEVSTICHKGCPFCYKNNVARGKNMSLATFKSIVDKIPTLQQIAFGIGDIDANPDLLRMFAYCREKNIVPNVTINGTRMEPYLYDGLAYFCGAVAVSLYDYDDTLNAVYELTSKGMTQVNIHALLARETLGKIFHLFIGIAEKDSRLEKLNAVVFLSLKQKGRGVGYTPLTQEEYKKFMDLALNFRVGFDSCSANKFLAYLPEDKRKLMSLYAEPCESGLFSSYIDVDGVYYPCSFSPGKEFGIDVTKVEDFLQDVWYHPRTIMWRKALIKCGRNCPLYKV